MKKTLKITLALILVCVISFTVPIFADTIFSDMGFSYTQLDGNYASICDWEGGSDTMKIPLMLNDSYVKEIASWSFNGRDNFSKIDFTQADYLNAINSSAFKDCTGLTGSLNIPAQVSSIGVSAFQGCSSLEILYYNTTADVSNQCFYLCSSLREIYLADGVSSIGRFAFANCENLELIWITKSVTYIDPTAFNNSQNVVIYCYYNSYAHQYAEDNGISYVLIDPPAPTEPPTEPETEAPVTEAPTDEPTQEPTAEPETQASTEEAGYILGDVDGNGIVEIIDATILQRYCALMDVDYNTEQLMHGDVDGNGTLEIIDTTFIMRYIVLMEVPYPIGERADV